MFLKRQGHSLMDMDMDMDMDFHMKSMVKMVVAGVVLYQAAKFVMHQLRDD